MITRNINGKLIKLSKYDYPNDMIYYEKIMNIKKEFTKESKVGNNSVFPSQKKDSKLSSVSLDNILDFIKITSD
jgi:hypothetical protein